MYGKDILLRVEIVMSDGDPNEFSQIDESIDMFMKFAIRLRCGWHIVVKGFKKYAPKITADCQLGTIMAYKSLKKLISNWIYSWMRCNCECDVEVHLSIKILRHFIQSEFVTNHFSADFISQMLDWIKSYVEPHLYRIAFYRKNMHRCFDVYTNCAQESVHHGMKFNAVPVTEYHSVTKSAIILSTNGLKKCAETERDYTTQLRKNYQHHDAFIGCGFILDNAQEMGREQWDLRFNYENKRKLHSLWLVRHLERRENSKSDAQDNMNIDNLKERDLLPDFVRIRIVIEKNGVFYCSCCFFQRWAFACRHIWNVLSSFPLYDRPSSKDFGYRWQKNVCYFWLCTTMSKDLKANLEKLMDNDIEGPYCDPNIFKDLPIDKDITDEWDPNVVRCTNYDIRRYLNGQDHLSLPAGLTQLSTAEFQSQNAFNQSTLTYSTNDPFIVAATRYMNNLEKELTTCNKSTAYAEVMPLSQEIIRLLQMKQDDDLIVKTKELLNTHIAELKAGLVKESRKRERTENVDKSNDLEATREETCINGGMESSNSSTADNGIIDSTDLSDSSITSETNFSITNVGSIHSVNPSYKKRKKKSSSITICIIA